MRILVLGAGFGGLELVTRLSDECDDVEIDLIDQNDAFIFGFSKLDVMFGHALPDDVEHRYASIAKRGVRFTQTVIRSIDPTAKAVFTDAGRFEADIMVVALGADLDPAATPGLVEVGYEFYTVAGAFALRPVLEEFSGGRVVVGVTSTPFKCPPAPSETVLLMHDLLTRKGVRESSTISLVMPLGVPIPPSPPASQALLAAFAERDIGWYPERLIVGLDPDRKVALFDSGDEMEFDLFLGVPAHRAPAVVVESGMTENGWIPVNPLTLETSFSDVYAMGDVTSVGTPKAGVFAEGQASVVADQIVDRTRAASSPASAYDGHGTCYLEFGDGTVATVDVTFLSGAAPVGDFQGPSRALAATKLDFGVSRVRRWFGRSWNGGKGPAGDD